MRPRQDPCTAPARGPVSSCPQAPSACPRVAARLVAAGSEKELPACGPHQALTPTRASRHPSPARSYSPRVTTLPHPAPKPGAGRPAKHADPHRLSKRTPTAQASDPHLWGLSPIAGHNPCVPCPGPRQLRSLWVRATHPTHACWVLPISVQCPGLWSPWPALPTCLLCLPFPLPPSPLPLLSPLAQGCCPFADSLMARPAVGWTVSRASPASLVPRVQTGHGQVACLPR